jgi:hypothetical protein
MTWLATYSALQLEISKRVTPLEIGLWGGGLTNGEDYRYHTTMVIYTQEKTIKIFIFIVLGQVVWAQYITEPCQLHLQNWQN